MNPPTPAEMTIASRPKISTRILSDVAGKIDRMIGRRRGGE
jgi:hypothetical protein